MKYNFKRNITFLYKKVKVTFYLSFFKVFSFVPCHVKHFLDGLYLFTFKERTL